MRFLWNQDLLELLDWASKTIIAVNSSEFWSLYYMYDKKRRQDEDSKLSNRPSTTFLFRIVRDENQSALKLYWNFHIFLWLKCDFQLKIVNYTLRILWNNRLLTFVNRNSVFFTVITLCSIRQQYPFWHQEDKHVELKYFSCSLHVRIVPLAEDNHNKW